MLPGMGSTTTVFKLADSIATTGVQTSVSFFGRDIEEWTAQATVQGTGAVSATVQIEVSNDGVGWLVDSVSTLSLSGTGIASAGFTSSAPWQFVRANITAISGTNARVTVTIGG